VIDVNTDKWLYDKYRSRVPILAVETDRGVHEVPHFSPRLTADSLGKRLETYIRDHITDK
jgi:hypothetical protein